MMQLEGHLSIGQACDLARVKRALTRLVNLRMVYGPELACKFFDPFFKRWVLREL